MCPSEGTALLPLEPELSGSPAGPSQYPERGALGIVGSAVVSLATGLCIPSGLCLVWVGVTTSLLWRKLRQRV